MPLYYASAPACSCCEVDDWCTGCNFTRFTAFVRGWSWVAVAISKAAR